MNQLSEMPDSPRLWPVIGPLVEPDNRSGVHYPTCPHVAPWSCPKCDGTHPTDLDSRAVDPPCMRKETP